MVFFGNIQVQDGYFHYYKVDSDDIKVFFQSSSTGKVYKLGSDGHWEDLDESTR